MTSYGPETTTDEVLLDHDLTGRHFMITGASSGLGEESARALAQAGATVTMLARNQSKLDKAIERIKSTNPSAVLKTGIADLSDQQSIRDYAQGFLATGETIDVLINNAGVMVCPFGKTADGIEMQFGTNHVGHFLLTNLLMPAILAGANPRIVNLSSAGHTHSDVNLDDPNFEKSEYNAWESYGRSKSANIHFTQEIVRRYGDRIQSFAVHPGVIMTELGRHLTPELMNEMTEKKIRHPHSGTFSANPISMTAGYTAMKMFDKQAVLDLNKLTKIAIKQIEESISLSGIPACVTGDGSMFRVHFNNNKPTTYREAYQEKEIKTIINELLDYLFLKENIIMINTCACMFSTTLNQQHVDRLSEALLNGFRIIKPKLENIS